jgi:magnesium-transporting ATPase (P-type)
VNAPDESDDERRAKGLPPEPAPIGEDRPAADPPRLVNISFALWIASSVVLIVAFVVILIGKQTFIDQLVKANKDPRVSPAQIASGTTALLWVLLVGAVVFALLNSLFAYKAREGTRSARTVLTVLTVIVLFVQAFLFTSVVSAFAALLAIAALVLMYLPSVRDYFPKVGRKLP